MKVSESSFEEEVYSVVKQIPYGKVLSYGIVAALAGYPGCSRMVGRALHNAPHDSGITCHRVVNGNGRTAPFWNEHKMLLEAEGVTFRRNDHVDMAKHLWCPDDTIL